MRKPVLARLLALFFLSFLFACKKDSSEAGGPDGPPDFSIVSVGITNSKENIFIYTGDIYHPTNVTPKTAVSTTKFQLPKWGANNKIYFLSNLTGETNYQVYSMNADGTGVVRISNNLDHEYYNLQVSKKSGRILFNRYDHAKHLSEIGSWKQDGTDEKIIMNDMNETFVGGNWFPDGETIILSFIEVINNRESWNLHSIKYDGTGRKRITNESAVRYFLPTIAPNGERIAYNTSDYHVYFANDDMSIPTEIKLHNSPNITWYWHNIGWCTDNRWIAGMDGQGDVYLVDTEGDGSKSLVAVRAAVLGSADVK